MKKLAIMAALAAFSLSAVRAQGRLEFAQSGPARAVKAEAFRT